MPARLAKPPNCPAKSPNPPLPLCDETGDSSTEALYTSGFERA
jgi:hypothetical protein